MIHKVEVALSQEVDDPPILLVENINAPNKEPYSNMVCDSHQVVYFFVQAVLRFGKLNHCSPPVVRIQLHPTALQFSQADPIDSKPS